MKKIFFRHYSWAGLAAVTLLLACSKSKSGDAPIDKEPDDNDPPVENVIGKVLPAWSDGYLDIHAINTGRGESTLMILPDGTTMLIDGASSTISDNEEIPPTPQKPSKAVAPGLAITNYARHFIKTASNKLNYILLTHYDNDHLGGYSESLPMDPTNSFRVVGITEVGSKLPVDKLVDRSYPDFDIPVNKKGETRIANYINYIEWAKREKGLQVERFEVGSNQQFVLKENPGKYPDFEIRNLYANGVVWTGQGNATRNTFPSFSDVAAAGASENIFSTVFMLRYGKFDFFTGADLQFNGRSAHPWKDVEAPVSTVVRPVEVMKANHHATSNCNGDAILSALKPQTVMVHVWRDVQPNPETIARFFQHSPNVQLFTTNMTDANKTRLGGYFNRMRATQGHIVVRVKPGGDEYMVYVLDDTNQDYKVKAMFGPYTSK